MNNDGSETMLKRPELRQRELLAGELVMRYDELVSDGWTTRSCEQVTRDARELEMMCENPTSPTFDVQTHL